MERLRSHHCSLSRTYHRRHQMEYRDSVRSCTIPSRFRRSTRSSCNRPSRSSQNSGPTACCRTGECRSRFTPQMAGCQIVPCAKLSSWSSLVSYWIGDFNSSPVSTEEADPVGIMSKHFVRCIHSYYTSRPGRAGNSGWKMTGYRRLLRALDDFGPGSWTGQLRHFVPGFAPFRGRA